MTVNQPVLKLEAIKLHTAQPLTFNAEGSAETAINEVTKLAKSVDGPILLNIGLRSLAVEPHSTFEQNWSNWVTVRQETPQVTHWTLRR
jgi:hypothetical protein